MAVLLYLLHHPKEIPQRASLEEILEGMSREDLIDLVQQLASIHPEVMDLAETFSHASRSFSGVRSGLPSDMDISGLIRRIRTELYRLAQAYFYDPYAFEEELPFTALFDPLLQRVQAQTKTLPGKTSD